MIAPVLIVAVCGVLLLAPMTALRVRVSPRIGLAPVDIRIEVSISQDPDNRAYEVRALADGFVTHETTRSLDGDDSPVTQDPISWRLDAGHYEIQTVLIGARGVRARDQQTVDAIGAGDR